jgi:predicted ATP-dependent protease
MAGRIHNKGFLILRGFLTDRFGQNGASTLHASLTFEQLYGDIDGDSASSTELYVLLSALAELPIKQGLAVTGSVDQHGRVQPIGGATSKIEGFHAICSERGLDGTHGVLIPRTNVENVVLRPEVARDVEAGRFHVWGVETIEEGIELLTGVPAGVPDENGEYPEGTVFRRVRDRLAAFAEELRGRPEVAAAPTTHLHTAPAPAPTPPGIPPQPPPEPPVIV